MTRSLIAMFVLGSIVAVLSCDGPSGSGACPLGTFRPVGGSECVIPARDHDGNERVVDDNRCTGNIAVPPTCSNAAYREYVTGETGCAPGYSCRAGYCLIGPQAGMGGTAGTTGSDGTGFFTGSDGTGFNVAGTSGQAGCPAGFACDGTGFTHSDGTGFGCAGTTGCDGTGFSTGSAGVKDASSQ
jgi:hypothetical protein